MLLDLHSTLVYFTFLPVGYWLLPSRDAGLLQRSTAVAAAQLSAKNTHLKTIMQVKLNKKTLPGIRQQMCRTEKIHWWRKLVMSTERLKRFACLVS